MENITDSQKAIAWAEEYLANNGYFLQSAMEPVRIMPWSSINRILTSVGYVYLKQMSLPFSVEAKLVTYLAKQFSALLPEVIAINEVLNCFLMRDAGVSLRDILKTEYKMQLACKALDIYVVIQQGAVKHIDDLLALGVPDWRLAKLPYLYQALLSKREFLEIDGLKQSEIDKLQNLHSKFVDLCELLSCYNIPETIEHSDFHDNNILVNAGYLTINDWGDAIISHPFFSLISFLKSVARNHHITEKNNNYYELQDTYLNSWLKFESKNKILPAFELAKRIGPVKFAMSFYRVTLCSGMDALKQYKGTIAKALQTFLEAEET